MQDEKSESASANLFRENEALFEELRKTYTGLFKERCERFFPRGAGALASKGHHRANPVEYPCAAPLNDERWNEDWSEDDCRTISSLLYPDVSSDEAEAIGFKTYAFAEASCGCLRGLSMTFEDLRKGDWMPLYADAYRTFNSITYSSMICRERGDVYPLNALVADLNSTVEELEAKILAGATWNCGRDAIEADRKREVD